MLFNFKEVYKGSTWFWNEDKYVNIYLDENPCKSTIEAVNVTLKDFLRIHCTRKWISQLI